MYGQNQLFDSDPILSSRMTARGAGNIGGMCAACKHFRRKCSERCIFSPYFPAENIREFQAVTRVFGASNLMKMMLGVSEADRRQLVESLVWEAFVRERDPVLGIHGEYTRALDELLYFKALTQMNAERLLQLQAQIERIGGDNNGNGNDNVSVPSGHIEWYYENKHVANLGSAVPVTVAVPTNNTNNNNPMTPARGNQIINAIPNASDVQNQLWIRNEGQEREVSFTAAAPSLQPTYEDGFNLPCSGTGEK